MTVAKKPTLGDYAEFVGISKNKVSDHIRELFGKATARPPVGEFLLLYCEKLRKAAAGRSMTNGAPRNIDPVVEKAKLDRARRQELERKAHVECGKLVLAEEYEAALAKSDAAIRTAIFAVPAECSEQIAAMALETFREGGTMEECQRQLIVLLTDRLREALLALPTDF